MPQKAAQSPVHLSVSERELRAGERVRQYLLAEFDRPHLQDGSRLPTNKELASRLDVSLGTVQAVLRQLSQEGRIRSRRGSGTYLVSSASPSSRTRRIGVGIPIERFQNADGWLSRIAGGVFQAALASNSSIEGISDQSYGTSAMVKELEEKQAHLDALILFPYTISPQHGGLIDAFEKAGKPVVRIYPPSLTATANFVTPDFLGSSYQLGQVWRKTGRRRALMLTNQAERDDMRMNVSNQLRFAGLAAAFGSDLNVALASSLRTIPSERNELSVEAGYIAVKKLIQEGGNLPDAVYCAGDHLAMGALQAFREARISVPRGVSIVGASGMDLARTDCPNLTRVSHDLETVGQNAMKMILRRLELNGLSLPGEVIPSNYIGGATSRPEENTLLGIA